MDNMGRLVQLILVMIISALLMACAQKGDDFLADNRFEAAADIYMQAAERGDVNKMMRLAEMYSAGKIEYHRNYTQAVYWYTRAAEQEVVSAMYNLAFIYEYGQGEVEQNESLAEHWYYQAAIRKHAYSQYRLANLMANQLSELESDKAIEAERWFIIAGQTALKCSGDPLCRIVQEDLFNYRWRLERQLSDQQKAKAQVVLENIVIN